jgi:hypothetical protein
MEFEHQPSRPAWTCQTCSEPWPCAGAQQRMLMLYRGQYGDLGRHLGARYVAMRDDLDGDSAELLMRVFGWLLRSKR